MREAYALLRQAVDMGSLIERGTKATHVGPTQIIDQKEDDVGLFGSLRRAQRQKVKGDDEFFHFVFFNSSSDP